MADAITNSKRKIKNPVAIIPGRNFDWQAGPNTADKRTYQLLREMEQNKAEIGVVTLEDVDDGDILVYSAAETKWKNQKFTPARFGVGLDAPPTYRFEVLDGTSDLVFDTTTGLRLSENTSASGRAHITLVQQAANNFGAISFNDAVRIISDNAKANVASLAIRDDLAGAIRMFMDSSGRFSIGASVAPTARLMLPAGAAGASSAPLKLTSGTNLTTPEAGVMEYDGANFYFTPASTRKVVQLGAIADEFVTIQPAATARNVIQPTANVVPLTLKAFGGASDLLVFRDSSDNLVGSTNQNGEVWSGANSSGGAIYIGSNKLPINQNPDYPFQIQVSSHLTTSAGVVAAFGGTAMSGTALASYSNSATDVPFIGRAHSAQTAPLFILASAGGAYRVQFLDGRLQSGLIIKQSDTADNNLGNYLEIQDFTGAPIDALDYKGDQHFYRVSSTTFGVEVASFVFGYLSNTHASRQGKFALNCFDQAGTAREILQGVASGSGGATADVPMVGFLGANAVVRQTLAAAATDLATVITLANSLRTAQINLGLGV